MVALNLKRRKEGMEVVNVLGAGNGKTHGVGERHLCTSFDLGFVLENRSWWS